MPITSLLNPITLLEAGALATAAAQATEPSKHQANDPKCSGLGWVHVFMIPGCLNLWVGGGGGPWGKEATALFLPFPLDLPSP